MASQATKSHGPERTTVRMNPALRQQLEEIALKEGKTFTALLHQAGWEFVSRQSRPSADEPMKLPLLRSKTGKPIDFGAVRKSIEAEDAAWAERQMGKGLSDGKSPKRAKK
jgi:hypothetical protein